MLCALGIMMALYEVKKGGNGQVVDSSMTDGAAYLSTFIYSLYGQGISNRYPFFFLNLKFNLEVTNIILQ